MDPVLGKCLPDWKLLQYVQQRTQTLGQWLICIRVHVRVCACMHVPVPVSVSFPRLAREQECLLPATLCLVLSPGTENRQQRLDAT